jgi:hypothetical protein
VEYYFGYSYDNSDLSCQDFTTRENMFKQSNYALDFFRTHKIPFHEMISSNNPNTILPVKLSPTSTDWLLSMSNGLRHVIYRKIGNAPGNTITGLSIGDYDIKWYNPRLGGPLQIGTKLDVNALSSNGIYTYGFPPSTPTLDWVILLRKK